MASKSKSKHQNGFHQSYLSSKSKSGWKETFSYRSDPTPVSRYRKKIEKVHQLEQQSKFNSTAFVPSLAFNLQDVCRTYAHKCLSMNQSCSKCLPNSRDHCIDKEYFNAGLQDLLIVNKNRVRGLFYWICPTVGWACQMNLPSPVINPKKETLSSARVLNAVEKSAKLTMSGVEFDSPSKPNINTKVPTSEEAALRKEHSRAVSIINTMCGPVYLPLLRLAYYTMMWVFGKLFKHFYVQRSHVEMLKNAQSKNLPMVFLPCHKSHVDYIIMTFTLMSIGIKVPHVAAGDNLNIPLFNWLIHHLGGFFIRRRLDVGNVRDELYRDCLHEYIEQLLKANQNLEIYIEGSRSRSGKPSLPKTGLLSFLVDAVRNGSVSDILIVPVAISYDRIIERNFTRRELMGGNKTPENFFKAMGGVWRMITSDIGCVRVDFAQPFSLQEYLNTGYIAHNSLLDFSVPNNTSLLMNTSTQNLSTLDRRIITSLSHHIVYDFNQTSTVMSTNIVGFLLLTKHRYGVKIPQLINSYKWVADKINTNGKALGYSGPPSEAVHYALNYLHHLTVHEHYTFVNSKGIEESYKVVYPKLIVPDVFQLTHHFNQVNVLFVKESIIACSLTAIQEIKRCRERKNNSDIDDHDSNNKDKKFVSLISQTELLEYAIDLTELLAKEFIYAPPCINISTVLYEGIESLIAANVLKLTQTNTSSRAIRDLVDDDWDDDEDEQDVFLEFINTHQSNEHLQFLQSILGPYIEGYWNVANELLELNQEIKSTKKETDFLQDLQSSMLHKHKEGTLIYIECCSMDILRNAFRSFLCMELIAVNKDSSIVSVLNQSSLIDVINVLAICK